MLLLPVSLHAPLSQLTFSHPVHSTHAICLNNYAFLSTLYNAAPLSQTGIDTLLLIESPSLFFSVLCLFSLPSNSSPLPIALSYIKATRRSSRITKGKRLAYWRGERPVYQNVKEHCSRIPSYAMWYACRVGQRMLKKGWWQTIVQCENCCYFLFCWCSNDLTWNCNCPFLITHNLPIVSHPILSTHHTMLYLDHNSNWSNPSQLHWIMIHPYLITFSLH